MKNPMISNWIRFKRISDDEYEIIDLLNDEIMNADAYTVWFAKQLNGQRDPYQIDVEASEKDIDLLLCELEDAGIIREKRFLAKSLLHLLVTVWQPRVTLNFRVVSFLINGLLLISWLPLLVFSILYFSDNAYDLTSDYVISGSIIGLIIGLIMHEFGHLFACIAYGGRAFEVGFLFRYFIPGAYVLMNKDVIKKRMRRIQVSAAGIEMNFFLAATFLFLSAISVPLNGFFLGAAVQNVFIALLNLTFIKGFDGMTIMSELLGVDELVDRAKVITKSRKRKSHLRNCGISGRATIVLCYALRGIQVALPLLFVLNIVGVISWWM